MKKILAIMLTFVLCFGVLSFAFASENETAVPDGYTGIYTAEDLDNIRNNLSGKYILMNDIDLSSYGNWNPIGTSEAPFTGELDGNGYAVKNIKIEDVIISSYYAYSGFIAYMKDASLIDMSLQDLSINISKNEDLFYSVGGIAGKSYSSKIENCIITGKINIKVNGTCYCGGIVGYASGALGITECRNYADIDVSAFTEINVGGIAGGSSDLIKMCANEGNISVTNGNEEIEERYYIYIGGICGNMYLNDVENCYNTGNIKTNLDYEYPVIGGLCGRAFSVSNSFNTGKITCSETSFSDNTGGIAGVTIFHFDGMEIMPDRDSYLINCYYLDNIERASVNTQPERMVNVKSLTIDEMKIEKSFVGFDFEKVWEMDEELGRPVLQSEPIANKEPDFRIEQLYIVKVLKEILNFIKNFFGRVFDF